jgi:hypothetical protein
MLSNRIAVEVKLVAHPVGELHQICARLAFQVLEKKTLK